MREWLKEAAEAEVAAAAECEVRANGSARDAACLPFGMVGELRRKLGPIALAVLLVFMGVGIMNIRVSAEFPCLRQRAAFSIKRGQKVLNSMFSTVEFSRRASSSLQACGPRKGWSGKAWRARSHGRSQREGEGRWEGPSPVSYTHLTLPTKA